jgi:hydrogenase maturation protease
MRRLKVIGIGQSFRGDDAIGIIIVEEWWKHCSIYIEENGIKVETSSLPGVGLIDMLAGFETVIFVDAVQTGIETPGTIYKLREKQLASFVSSAKSAHGWGAAESLKLGRELRADEMPEIIRILGVEAAQFEIGADISEAIKEKIPEIIDTLQSMVEEAFK